jgi:hypothetical protein
MSSPVVVTLSPEESIFTFKQGGEENFKEAWSRIFDSYSKTEPKMTLSLLLSNFYFGLILRYRYALDAVVGGDFLHCDGDQAFNAIRKLITSFSSDNNFDPSHASMHNRLNTIETNISCLKEVYNQIREYYDYVPLSFEPSMWVPTVKATIGGETFLARCDIMSEFCLMPESIYESLTLWKLTEGGEEITLTDNSVVIPKGIAEGVFTTFLGRTVSTDYLVIECVGAGQITLGRSLLKLMGAVIDVGKGTLNFTSTPGCGHVFPRPKSRNKSKKGKSNTPGKKANAPSLDNT